MFSRTVLAVSAVVAVACCVLADVVPVPAVPLAIYTPAVVFVPGMESKSVIKTPLTSPASDPMGMLHEIIADFPNETANAPKVFILEKRGLNAKMLTNLSNTFLAALPTVSAEAAYTSGVNYSALDVSYGCMEMNSEDEVFSFLMSNFSSGKSVAICVKGDEQIVRACNLVLRANANAVIVVTGPFIVEQEPDNDDESGKTVWPGGVVEALITFVAALVPLALAFHLLFAIRPVEDVQYPKHKIL